MSKVFKVLKIVFSCIAFLFYIGLCALSIRSCPAKALTYPTKGTLKGYTILSVALPPTNLGHEVIFIDREQNAYRFYTPRSDPLNTKSVYIPNELWYDLQALQQAWCKNPPRFPTKTPRNLSYEVILQCGCPLNPNIQVPPDQIPAALNDLVQVTLIAP